jgi:predicted nucleotidyltransferase component of viral defense system
MEISLREGGKKGEVVTIASDYIPSFTVVALVREQLVAEKIQALLTRKKARDLYDLYFILRANLLSARDKAVLAKALPVLKQSRINFERELKEFLPKSHWAILRDFPTTLEREMQRFL